MAEMRQYLDRSRRGWKALVEADRRIHEYLYAHWPRAMRIGGTGLRFVYSVCISPAFAVVLSLILVGFVISGVVTIIVSLSVFAAWAITTLSVAKARSVNKLRIVPRLICVGIVGTLLAFTANAYVKWCLRNYHHNNDVATRPPPSPQSSSQTSLDALAYQRIRAIFDEEMKQYGHSSNPQRQPRPSVGAETVTVLPPNPSLQLLSDAEDVQAQVYAFTGDWEAKDIQIVKDASDSWEAISKQKGAQPAPPEKYRDEIQKEIRFHRGVLDADRRKIYMRDYAQKMHDVQMRLNAKVPTSSYSSLDYLEPIVFQNIFGQPIMTLSTMEEFARDFTNLVAAYALSIGAKSPTLRPQ